MSIRIEDETVNLTKRCVYPTVMNNILDISELKSDVLIEHKIDLIDPVNLVIISRNSASNIKIYMKASLIKNKGDTENTDKVRKLYNKYPLIVNTTSAKLILWNYQVDFIIDTDRESIYGSTTDCCIVKIPTPLLCNNVHSVHNALIKVYSKNFNSIDQLFVADKTQNKPLCIERMVKSIETSYEEIIHAKREYIPSIHDISTDRFHRLNQVRDGFICMLKPNYSDDKSLSAFIEIIELRSQIDYTSLKKNLKYELINFNGLIVDVCTGKFVDSQVDVYCDVKFSGRYLNGMIGGYVDTLQDVKLDVHGDVSMSRSKNSIFTGICSGISRWIDNVHIHIMGDVEITGKVSGLMSGSASGMFGSLECKIRDRIDLYNEKRFGTVVGYLSHVDKDKKPLNGLASESDNFNFKFLLHVNGIPTATLKSSTSGVKHSIIGELDPDTSINKIDNVLNEDSDDFIIPSNDDYVYDDQDIEGIYEDKYNNHINLNRNDSKSRSKFNITKVLSLDSTVPIIKNGYDLNLSNYGYDLGQNHKKTQDVDVTRYVDDVLNQSNIKKQKISNDTYDRHNSAWCMFNLIKQTRNLTGISINNFPVSHTDKRYICDTVHKRTKADKNIFKKSKKPTLSEIMQDDEFDNMNEFEEISTKDPDLNPNLLKSNNTQESAIYNLGSDSTLSDEIKIMNQRSLDESNDKRIKNNKHTIKSDKQINIKIDTDEIFDDHRYKVTTASDQISQTYHAKTLDRVIPESGCKQIRVVNKKQRGKLYDIDTDTLKFLSKI